MISAYDVRTTIYEIPLTFAEQKVDEIIIKKLGLAEKRPGPRRVEEGGGPLHRAPSARCAIAIVGKYTGLHDSYISIFESLFHGGIANGAARAAGEVRERGAGGRAATSPRPSPTATASSCPAGFGLRGIEGMIRAAQLRAGEQGPLPRHLPGHADHGDRVRARSSSA